jgi:hypothetical protein
MEKITKNKNGQWDIEKAELNLDNVIEDNKKGPANPPDFPSISNEKAEESKQEKKKDKKVKEIKKSDIIDEKLEQLEKALGDFKNKTLADVQAANKVKQRIGVKTTSSGEAVVGTGPALSGIPKHYPMAVTKTGKQIMSTHGKGEAEPYHSSFTPEDHQQAYWAHGEKAKELSSPQMRPHVHPDLPAHHEAMAKFHWNEYIKSK